MEHATELFLHSLRRMHGFEGDEVEIIGFNDAVPLGGMILVTYDSSRNQLVVVDPTEGGERP